MRTLRPQRLELIDALVAESALGGITAGLLEKDEHLTDALRALFALRLDGVSLAFCGGTSLSKAHGLIELPTVAVAETLAEKVLSFLRRYAQHQAGLLQRDWDTALVRHIYDVHCVCARHPDIVVSAAHAFAPLVAGDQKV